MFSIGKHSKNVKRKIIPNWHHSKGNVFRAHVISTLDFIDFISLRHNNAVML